MPTEDGIRHVIGSLTNSSIVNVNEGGTLSGGGVLGKVNVNGGTVSAGNTVGTLHIDGDYAMTPDSTYHDELNGDRSDEIVVSGAADIQSSTVEIAHDTNPA